MALKQIYSGSIAIDATDYTHTVAKDDDYVDVPIDDLDVLVTRKTHLRFTLDYPFSGSYEGTVIGDGGISLRQIIDAIRSGFREMYRGASEEAIPNLMNRKVQGTYGQAFHVIGDLVIEELLVDEETGLLDIGIGS